MTLIHIIGNINGILQCYSKDGSVLYEGSEFGSCVKSGVECFAYGVIDRSISVSVSAAIAVCMDGSRVGCRLGGAHCLR